MSHMTKPCLACCQPIDAAATKCQHCHQVQSSLAGLQNKPLVHFLALAVIVVIFAGILYSLYSAANKPFTTPALVPGPATVLVGKPDERLRVSCFSTIKNPGPHTWGNLSLQAEFFNAKGERVDVLYQEHRVSIYPSLSMEARVSGQPNADVSGYASCKISVINAS